MILWKKIIYYFAILNNAVAYVGLIAAVKEIQKHKESGKICFKDWPKLGKKCSHFDESNLDACGSCPLSGVFGLYLKANERHKKTRNAVYLAQTRLLCAMVSKEQ